MRLNPRALPVSLTCFLAVSIGWAGFAAAVGSAEIEVPLTLSTQADAPAAYDWVAAEAAFVGDQIRWDLFGPEAKKAIQNLLASATSPEARDPWDLQIEGCLAVSRVLTPPRNDDHALGSVQDLARSSDTVLLGRVVAARQGFHHGSLKTLYALQPIEVVKNNQRLQSRELLFFYPYARVPFQSGFLCGAGPRFPEHPEIGDRILLLTSSAIDDGSNLLFFPTDSELFLKAPTDGFLCRIASESSN